MSKNSSEPHPNSEFEQGEEEHGSELPPPRRGPSPVLIGIIVALIVVIVGGGIYAGLTLSRKPVATSATPAVTVPPGANLFYIVANPGYGTISIDGHPVTHLPIIGQAPLQLSPGTHVISWNAPTFPVQRCIVDVPPQTTGSSGVCNDTQSANITTGANAGLQATVVSFAETTKNLSASQQSALMNAVQAYLQTLQANATVQTGQSYASLQAPHNVTTATQPLKATIHFQLDTNPNSSQPCMNDVSGGTSCSVDGVSCQTFCPISILSGNGSELVSASTSWQVYTVMQITWSYTTLGGQIVAQNEPDATVSTSYEYLVPLSISWNGSTWQVQSDQPGAPPAPALFSDAVSPPCAAAQAWIKANPAHQSLDGTTFQGQQTAVNRQYIAGANAADGCTIKAVIPVPSAPVGELIYRFGVLLAVNNAAHQYWPSVPLAH
jgi:hypothetical protein